MIVPSISGKIDSWYEGYQNDLRENSHKVPEETKDEECKEKEIIHDNKDEEMKESSSDLRAKWEDIIEKDEKEIEKMSEQRPLSKAYKSICIYTK